MLSHPYHKVLIDFSTFRTSAALLKNIFHKISFATLLMSVDRLLPIDPITIDPVPTTPSVSIDQ